MTPGMPSIGGTDYLDEVVEGWVLTIPGKDEHLSDGLRLSTGCPCRRVREWLDPTLYAKFPVPLSTRGTLAELAYRACHLAGEHQVLEQVVIPWEFGDSHLDFVIVNEDGTVRLDELKCNGDGAVDPENIEQVQRQQYVVQLAIEQGVTEFRSSDGKQTVDAVALRDALWRVVVMMPVLPVIHDVAGYTVRLHEPRRLELDAEWAEVREVMTGDVRKLREDIHWPMAFPSCTCGKCWREVAGDGNLDVVEQVNRYVSAREDEKYAKQEKELAADELKQLVPQNGQPLIAGDWKVVYSPPGEDVEKFDYAKGYAALGTDATHDELREAGYSKVGPKSPGGLRVNPYKAPKALL